MTDALPDDELRAMSERATPGPWTVSSQYGRGDVFQHPYNPGDQMVAVEVDAYDAALIAAMRNALPSLLDRLAHAEEQAKRLTDLTRRLGFGDNITEPQADNDTIVAWFDEQGRDASEWREHELWRNDCYEAGHSDDEDCYEHDPALRLAHVEARTAEAVEAGQVERLALDLASSVLGWQHLARYSGMGADWLDLTLLTIVRSVLVAQVRAARGATEGRDGAGEVGSGE